MKRHKLHGIDGYHIIGNSRISRYMPLEIRTQNPELIRKFLALKHRTSTGNIKFKRIYPIYFEGFKPDLG